MFFACYCWLFLISISSLSTVNLKRSVRAVLEAKPRQPKVGPLLRWLSRVPREQHCHSSRYFSICCKIEIGHLSVHRTSGIGGAVRSFVGRSSPGVTPCRMGLLLELKVASATRGNSSTVLV
ncbi:hypothetical protein TGP89_271985 [Toxoplasma gondii p89]|uniref:Transmembrane protein n=1 Tax=Toxoplasma gondii p89 TaxID=943119 RepID=A0A086L5H5_TOXGO|nr:hypothetical protein TGP89_271985 [Toxoplasma gondii p89]